MLFGLTSGEAILILFIFGLVYSAGHLPKLVALLGGERRGQNVKESRDESSDE